MATIEELAHEITMLKNKTSNWTPWDAVFEGAGASTNVISLWRRIGDSMDVISKISIAAVGATKGCLVLPDSNQIDTSKITHPSGIMVGSWIRGNITTAVRDGWMVIATSVDVSRVYMGPGSSGYGAFDGLSPINTQYILNNGDWLSMTFTVPILGW